METKKTKLFYMVWLYLLVYFLVVIKGINNFSQQLNTEALQTQFELSMGLLLPHLVILLLGWILSVVASIKASYKIAFISALVIMFASGIYPHNFWWLAPVVLTAFLAYIKQKQIITRKINIFRV